MSTIDEITYVRGGRRLPTGTSFAAEKTQFPYLRVTDFENYSINQQKLRYLTPDVRQQLQNYTISSEDIYISITGTIGLVGSVPKELDGANLTENAAKIVIRPEYRDKVAQKYLMYFLASPSGVRQIKTRTTAVGQSKLALERIKTIEVPLPTIAEQRRVVAQIEALLSEVRECRLLHTRITQDTNQLMNAVLIEIFKDIEQQFPGEQQIGSITNVTSGGTPTRSRSEYYQGSIPWIKTGELKDNTIYEAEDYITEEAIENSNAKIYPVNTLLIAMYGQGQTRGRTGLLGIEAASNQACCAIYPAPARFNSEYLQFWFRSKYTRLRQESESRGGNQSNLNQSMIKSLTPPLPPIPRQVEVAEQLKQIECEIQEMYETESKDEILLLEIEQSILAQAFRGES